MTRGARPGRTTMPHADASPSKVHGSPVVPRSLAPVLVPLTRGLVAIVDAADAEAVLRHSWHTKVCDKRVYAATSIRIERKKYVVYLHRFILRPPPGMVIDHRDGDGLNNRRSNIRVCTHRENTRNRHISWGSSRFRGVYWNATLEKWVAQIRDGKSIYLGLFEREVAAAAAYDAAARERFGEYANPNLP